MDCTVCHDAEHSRETPPDIILPSKQIYAGVPIVRRVAWSAVVRRAMNIILQRKNSALTRNVDVKGEGFSVETWRKAIVSRR